MYKGLPGFRFSSSELMHVDVCMSILFIVYYYFIYFLFSHLADNFIQSYLQMRTL